MRTLNDPPGDEDVRADDWTPAIGLRRGVVYGLIAAVVLALLLEPLAHHLPYMVLILWLRGPLAFGLAWILFQVVHRAAGMEDPRCSALVLGLTTLVLLSHHLVFAVEGVPYSPEDVDWWGIPISIIAQIVPNQGGVLIGWQWCHPYALLALNVFPLLVGGGICVATCGGSHGLSSSG